MDSRKRPAAFLDPSTDDRKEGLQNREDVTEIPPPRSNQDHSGSETVQLQEETRSVDVECSRTSVLLSSGMLQPGGANCQTVVDHAPDRRTIEDALSKAA